MKLSDKALDPRAPSSDLVERLRKAMDGVTPGPWFMSGVRFRMNGGEWHSVNRYDETKKQDENIACVGYNPRNGVGLADAAYIALCSPDNIGALLDENTAQAARIAEQDGELATVREALEELAGEIESQRDAITHPHGQRAHFIDSQDQIRVDVLTGVLDRALASIRGEAE